MTAATKSPKPATYTDDVLAKALKVRQETGGNWKAVAAAVGVKSDGLLSSKVRAKYGDDAVRIERKPEPTPRPTAARSR